MNDLAQSGFEGFDSHQPPDLNLIINEVVIP